LKTGPFPLKKNFHGHEIVPKISLLKVFNSANHILQNFFSAENVPEWKWIFTWGAAPESQGRRFDSCQRAYNRKLYIQGACIKKKVNELQRAIVSELLCV
jgi:hypothetical protein